MTRRLPEIILCDINGRLCDAWKAVVDGSDIKGAKVRIENRNICELSVEAVVSPANSFGFMDGGIDFVFREFFDKGKEDLEQSIEKDARHVASQCDFGELLVGQAVVIPTGNGQIGHLILAPTMRVPMTIHDPVDVYLATRAAMKKALDWSFRRVGFPGMGTGAGMVNEVVAARCMARGIEDAIEPPGPPPPETWWHDHFNIPLRRLGGH